MMKSIVCVLLCLNVVCCNVRRQIVAPGGSHCDAICDEEIHSGTAMCTSDGILYKSRCEYTNAMCRASQKGETLSVVSYGACISMETPCDVVLQSRCLNLVNVFGGNTESSSEPICASNNRTYDSTCAFRSAQCNIARQSGLDPLTIAHTGKCTIDMSNALMVNCSRYVRPTSSSGLAVEVGTNIRPQGLSCPKIYKPICTNDARTFSNECSYCSYLVVTGHLTDDNMVTYAAHAGRCTPTDIFG